MKVEEFGLWWECKEGGLCFRLEMKYEGRGDGDGFTEQEAVEIAPQVIGIFQDEKSKLPFNYGYKKIKAAGNEFYVKVSHFSCFDRKVGLPRLKSKTKNIRYGKTSDISMILDDEFISELELE